jgi:hypothetical protein
MKHFLRLTNNAINKIHILNIKKEIGEVANKNKYIIYLNTNESFGVGINFAMCGSMFGSSRNKSIEICQHENEEDFQIIKTWIDNEDE